jgi:NTE family protein
MTIGLVLTGGGARAAYQVGVLKGIADVLPRNLYNPFPIITGTSAGAINAMSIAGRPGSFRLRVRKLETIWRNLHASDIYRTDFMGVTANSFHLLASLFHNGHGLNRPVSLLNNQPLKQLLDNYIRFKHLTTAIDQGELKAIGVTAMNYANGQSVTFFQGQSNIKSWSRSRRQGQSVKLDINHLMASTAIPSLFPAVKIDHNYFGDGALRQLKPLSPALHMGAKKLLTISVSNRKTHSDKSPQQSPSIASIIGQMLNSAFADAIESDLESLHIINRLTDELSQQNAQSSVPNDFHSIETLSISPSQSIDEIARNHIQELPFNLRLLLKFTGATDHSSGINAASYLLFEPGFCREIIDLGYRDALNQSAEIQQFFHV